MTLIWRILCVRFLASNRFLQKVVLICDREQVEELILGLENIDPHYKIIGYEYWYHSESILVTIIM
jgi:hypothetical protein